jgi:hypothetical protein
MSNVANLDHKEREDLFILTAREINLPEAMVEKDFWVCWVLDYLFHLCPWIENFAFKGGTSLSKCYGLINRFSEDIDIILDWRILGYDAHEPWLERSRTKQSKFNKEANSKTEDFLHNSFLPKIQNDFTNMLEYDFSLYMDSIDRQTVCFTYPCIFSESSLVSVVRLEIGALAAWTPALYKTIKSYAAQQ